MKKRTTTRLQTQEDNRAVAIYARKSVITHKGDSTEVQIKQSSDYACSQLSLPENYDFRIYEDKGLSGYYSDRPDFQRLLRDIENKQIKAVVCYKLDRISRKTSDLLRLMDYFDKYHVVLLVCSNNINTSISTSKIMISFLAIIAEFERDIFTERVTDNLVELSKDGRWMGGIAPTGYERYRVAVGSGKNKTAITHLKTKPDEMKMILEIYETFLRLRSIGGTRKEISEKYKTKNGAEHTTISIRDILQNPVYCKADHEAFQYFYDNEATICMDEELFTGEYGIFVYNRRDEMKLEHDDSTFFNPKFTMVHLPREVDQWLISIGKHEGFISGSEWVKLQNLLFDIADKYNRPHRVSHALLAGKVYCPICGHRLQVFAESARLNEDGTMRFKYGCPNQRGKDKTCTFKPVNGFDLDSFVIQQLCELSQEASKYYLEIMDRKLLSTIQSSNALRELAEARKTVEKLEADIAAQVRNMRDADDTIREFIQKDISQLSDDLTKTRKLVIVLEEKVTSERNVSKELTETRKQLLSFSSLIEGCSYEKKLGIVASVVDRVILRTEDSARICHIFIKGCPDEYYDDFYDDIEPQDSDCSLPASDINSLDSTDHPVEIVTNEMYNREQYGQLYSYLCGYPA